jgi:hypothetical protein
MLIAWIRKSRMRAKNFAFTEDEITSTVFGPIKFMDSRDAWRAVCEAGLVSTTPLRDAVPRRHFVDFWPPFLNPGRPRFDEWHHESPDVLFRFEFDNAQELWLILEVKWNEPQTSHDNEGRNTQLAHQWLAVTKSDRANDVRAKGKLDFKHTYLTKNFSEARSGIVETADCTAQGFDSDRKTWIANALPLTWADLRANLERLARNNSSQLCDWAHAVSEFLSIKNVMPFHGFRQLDPPDHLTSCAYRLRPAQFNWPFVCMWEPFRLKTRIQ